MLEKKFEKGERFFDKLPCEFKLMKAEIKFQSDKKEEAEVLFKSLWYEIEQDETFSNEDILYLKSRLSRKLRIYNEVLGIELGNIELVKIEMVDLSKVDKFLLKRFPSRDHPDWDKYGIE